MKDSTQQKQLYHDEIVAFESGYSRDESMKVNETQVKEIEDKVLPPKKGRFVLLAEKGVKPPKFVHSNLDSAINEAHRLAVITQGNVKILEVIGDVSYNVYIDAIFEKKTGLEDTSISLEDYEKDLPF